MGFFSGIFGANYTKEGPGVSKDEPQKPPFIRFFQLYFRKFWKLIQLNLIFLVPALVVAAMMVVLYLGSFPVNLAVGENTISVDLWKWYVMPLPLILLSPFVPGLAYVTRNYVREEHAFVFSDFKDAVKGNWKFFLLNGVITYLCYFILSIALRFYSAMLSTNKVMIIPFAISILFALLFLFAQFYIPVMAITFELKFREIYKNGFIFAVLGLWRNFLLLIVFAAFAFYAVFISPYMLLLVILLVLFFLLLGFSTAMYTVNFVVYPLIEKYLLKPYLEKDQPEKDTDAASEEENSLERNALEPKQSEFVYVNGKLIRREEAEGTQVFDDRQ